MAEALKSTTPSVVIPNESSSARELNFNDMKIREFDAMKDSIVNIKGMMVTILVHIKKP